MSISQTASQTRVTVRDEQFPGRDVIEMLLTLSSTRLTAKDLIAERVQAECDELLRLKVGLKATRLITPGTREQALNGPPAATTLNTGKAIERAFSAFETNGFILLVDDRQVETLEEMVDVSGDSIVTFLKLTPLVGG